MSSAGNSIDLLKQLRCDRESELRLVATLPAGGLGIRGTYDEAFFRVLSARARVRFCNGHTVSFNLTCNLSAMVNTLRTSSAISSHALGSRGVISDTAHPSSVALANAFRRRTGASIQVN
jgi:hypothetical protein